MQELISTFDVAAGYYKYPKLYMHLPNGMGTLRLHRAGPTAREPGAITLLHNGAYIGTVRRNGTIYWKTQDTALRAAAQAAMEAFMNNPAQAARIYGQQYNICCFCQRELTEKVSVALGYGPICAEKWGLAHDAKALGI